MQADHKLAELNLILHYNAEFNGFIDFDTDTNIKDLDKFQTLFKLDFQQTCAQAKGTCLVRQWDKWLLNFSLFFNPVWHYILFETVI